MSTWLVEIWATWVQPSSSENNLLHSLSLRVRPAGFSAAAGSKSVPCRPPRGSICGEQYNNRVRSVKVRSTVGTVWTLLQRSVNSRREVYLFWNFVCNQRGVTASELGISMTHRMVAEGVVVDHDFVSSLSVPSHEKSRTMNNKRTMMDDMFLPLH